MPDFLLLTDGSYNRTTTLKSSAVTTDRTNDETSPNVRPEPDSVEFVDGASEVPFSSALPFFPL
jgi:hypothetical protein